MNFNVFLNSGPTVDYEWYGGLGLTQKENKKVRKARADYRRSKENESNSLNLYKNQRSLSDYVSAAGGIFTSALSFYTNSDPEPYRSALAVSLGFLVAVGLRLLFNYFERKN